MKKILTSIFLSAGLIFAGCGKTEPIATEQIQETAATEPSQSVGAVVEFSLDRRYSDVFAVGDEKLLLTDSGVMTMVSGLTGQIIGQIKTGPENVADSPAFSVSNHEISCFSDGEVILFNDELQQSRRIQIPENAEGIPVVSLASDEIFYLEGNNIRAMKISSGVSRLVKTLHSHPKQITGVYFDGKVLSCQMAEGIEENVYLDTASGKSLWNKQGVKEIYSSGSRYLVFRMDGKQSQVIFGSEGKEPRMIPNTDSFYNALPAGGAVITKQSDHGVSLKLINLDIERCTASIPISEMPTAVTASKRIIWVLSGETLTRWDPSQTPALDDTVYGSPLYTEKNPDVDRIKSLRSRADQMARSTGVQIYLADQALTQAEKHILKQEYQVPILEEMLDGLENTMNLFPDGFLRRTIQGGMVKIGLARSLEGDAAYLQYFEKGNAWILLSDDARFPEDFLLAVGSAVDSHVLGNSRKYDNWDLMNPEGFSYSMGQSEQQNSDLATGSNRAFADPESMTYPSVERSRILCYAMTKEGKNIFCSPVMQKKLEVFCRAVREAYGLEKKEETYLWEQYLDTPIAYEKSK